MYDPNESDEYIHDGFTAEQEEVGVDTHIPYATGADAPAPAAAATQPARRVRVRPMSDAMSSRFPDVVSMLITKQNGRQVLLVRR
jgi:hypothetical protein